jgi:anti-sigma factor RsiW
MSCSAINLKDYFFGELPPQDRQTVDLHLASCLKCQEELDALNLTQNALLMVRDEEPPSRIAFVSDKVFEPRWYQSLWSSGPKMAFASSAVLAAAILVHGFEVKRTAVPLTQAAQPAITEAEVATRVQDAVQKAVAESEARQSAKLQQVVAHQRKLELGYKADRQEVSETFRFLRRSIPPNYRAASAITGEGQ